MTRRGPEADDGSLRDPALIERLAAFVDRAAVPYHRASVWGLERIPDGPALFVGNHNGGLMTVDSFIFCAAVLRARGLDEMPFGLAHDFVLNLPGLGPLLRRVGAVRACDDSAGRLFARGRKVLVYPGGDLDAMRPFRHRDRVVFGGRRGFVRTALRHGVPIVPVVAAGAHSTMLVIDDLAWLARWLGADRRLRIKVWPLALSFPWGLTLGPPPPYVPFPSRISIEVLEPIRFDRVGPAAANDSAYVEECGRAVEDAMQSALSRLARA